MGRILKADDVVTVRGIVKYDESGDTVAVRFGPSIYTTPQVVARDDVTFLHSSFEAGDRVLVSGTPLALAPFGVVRAVDDMRAWVVLDNGSHLIVGLADISHVGDASDAVEPVEPPSTPPMTGPEPSGFAVPSHIEPDARPETPPDGFPYA